LILGATIAALTAPAANADERHGRSSAYERLATYPVYLNNPAGADPAEETVAEISAVTRDGKTVLYTDAAQRRIGLVDISDPSAPRGLGTLHLDPGDAEGEATSVAQPARLGEIRSAATHRKRIRLPATAGALEIHALPTRRVGSGVCRS
jgi:hypothetical protein